MKLAYVREILTSQWMLEPRMASAYEQVFRGVLMGLQMDNEDNALSYYQDVNKPVRTYDKELLPSGKAINVISLKGIMTKEDGGCHYGTQSLADQLRKEDREDFVIGHVLVINSGGGSANSVPVLAEAIKACTKPVVAFVDGLMASAAMYAGSYCQHIVADSEDDRIGCIGTMIEIMDYPQKANLANGLITLRVYATESTEKNLEYEEALKGNVKPIIENILDPLNEKFLANMRINRPAVKDEQLKGRTYFAKDTVGTLIDEIGHIERAFEKVKELAGFRAEEEDENSNKPISNMKFDRINQIEGCEAVETAEGTATVTEAQLTGIEAKLTEDANTIAERDKTITSVNEQLSEAQQQITSLTETVSQREARITELESIINAKDDGTVEEKHHNGSQTADDGSDYVCEDPVASNREFIKSLNR